MRNFRYIWAIGLMVTGLIIILPIFLMAINKSEATDDPWAHVENRNPTTKHDSLIQGQFESGQEVTAVCLTCHENAAQEMMQTTHWTWQAEPVEVAWRDEPVSTGKSNVLNNFCLGIQSNWTGCTRCHAGYGWNDQTFFETATETQVDCLVCHDQSGMYVKAGAGLPADNPDDPNDLQAMLLTSAQSVGLPTRVNCGSCHFNGGGGNGVKHGDLDESLYFPSENLDVHMGELDFQCTTCHQTENHQVSGRAISVSVDDTNQIYCTDCHAPQLHTDERINSHTDVVACQTCHVPAFALRDPTKIEWDWSTAGQELEEDPHEYLKIKGSFIYEDNVIPAYAWFNGNVQRYLLGDTIDPTQPTILNQPLGNINDLQALIYPFKIHRGNQPYDVQYNYLLQPKTTGETGYWTTFDWNLSLQLGSAAAGIEYSGEYGFAPTEMYWVETHMVQRAENALQCVDCHGEDGRMDWETLGYPGDPMIWGGREN